MKSPIWWEWITVLGRLVCVCVFMHIVFYLWNATCLNGPWTSNVCKACRQFCKNSNRVNEATDGQMRFTVYHHNWIEFIVLLTKRQQLWYFAIESPLDCYRELNRATPHHATPCQTFCRIFRLQKLFSPKHFSFSTPRFNTHYRFRVSCDKYNCYSDYFAEKNRKLHCFRLVYTVQHTYNQMFWRTNIDIVYWNNVLSLAIAKTVNCNQQLPSCS